MLDQSIRVLFIRRIIRTSNY